MIRERWYALVKSLLPELALGGRYRTPRLLCGIVLYLVILLFGSIPGARTEIGNMAPGILLHATAYSLIAYLLFTGCRYLDRTNASRVIVGVAAMGAVDEVIQAFLPYRTGAIMDWLVDVIAGSLTVLVILRSLGTPEEEAARSCRKR
jgi:VanZ family protein